LEIHETAVTDPVKMAEMRAHLAALKISLAYDDFGSGQSRLNELIESPPDYLKFDMSLIRDIDSATPQRQQILATLVQMVRSLGIVPLAEGVETEGESATCLQMGFELGQGYLYGKPSAARKSGP
jgi:EAL domain-containing protein (putative c-di-GMP-specific phosphodiesterase class I)